MAVPSRSAFGKGIRLIAAALTMAACVPSGPSPPAYLVEPADADRPVAPLVYESVTGGTKTFRPVQPKGWEQQNRDAAPKPGEEGMSGMGHGSMKGMDHGAMGHGGMKGMEGPAAKDKGGGMNEEGGK